MLNEETTNRLKVLGFDVSKLSEAIKSEEESSLDVPELFTKEQKETFANNFSKQRFEEGKTAMSEIKAKELKQKYNIEIEGKDLENVVDEIIKSKTSNAKPDEKLKEKDNLITELRSKLETEVKQREKLDSEYKTRLFENDVNGKLLAAVPGKPKFKADHLITLYKSEYGLASDEGRAVVKKDGETIKDNLLNPISPTDHFAAWCHENNYVEKTGMNGESTTGGGSAKFKDMDSFMEYCKKNDIAPMGEEGQKLLLENKEF